MPDQAPPSPAPESEPEPELQGPGDASIEGPPEEEAPPPPPPAPEEEPTLLTFPVKREGHRGSAPVPDAPREPGRVLPHSIEAERALLCCLMLDPQELIGQAIEKMMGESFYNPANGLIFATLCELYDENKPTDLIALSQVFADRNQLAEVGGYSALAELISYVPTTSNFDYYLQVVTQKATLRGIINACTVSIQRAYEEQENVDEVIDRVEQDILAIRDAGGKTEFGEMKDFVMDAIDTIEKSHGSQGGVTGLSTGFRDLDEMTSGLHGAEMIVIAARPSMGKTSFCMNIVENVAVDQGKPVGVFSLEMSAASLVLRLLCARAGVDMQKVRGGFLSERRDLPSLVQAASVLAESPIYIDDTAGLSILELRAKARRMKDKGGIELIVVDYLQLARGTSSRAKDNRQLEIAEISAGLKGLAKEMNIPVIVVAQLNRQPEARTGGKPRLSDLRESGAIEQDADLVGLLVRSEVYEDDEDAREEIAGEAELIIAKQRNGPIGEVKLTFDKKYVRFKDRALQPD